MPLTPEELARFIDKTDELTREMQVHEQELRITSRRSERARNVATIGVVAALIGTAVGLGGILIGAGARGTADDLATTRKETQISSCVQANVGTQRTREALVKGVSILSLPDPKRTDAQQAGIDRFVTEYTHSVDAALPYRDCSERGIKLYYANPPDDPALGSVPAPATTAPATTVTR